MFPHRDEPVRDAPLIEYLDGAGVKTPGPRSVEVLTGASFDDDDVRSRQRQLAGNIIPVGPPPAITTARVLPANSSTGSALPLDPFAEGNTRIPQLLAS